MLYQGYTILYQIENLVLLRKKEENGGYEWKTE